MKKYIYRRIFFNLIVLSALIQIITIGSVFASVTLPIYKKQMPIRLVTESKAKTVGILCTRVTVRAHT